MSTSSTSAGHQSPIRRLQRLSATIPSKSLSCPPDQEENRPRKDWTGPGGYGTRHKLDDAPFSLWDEKKSEFRHPTKLEQQWLIKKFHPRGISFKWPLMIIQTDTPPPRPLPLTTGAVPVKFVLSRVRSPTDTDREYLLKELSLEDERPLSFPTDYAGMRGPADPILTPLKRWISPTHDQLRSLVETFQRFCNPRVISILCPHLIVEVYCDDQRTYLSGSLPRKVGGYVVHYHHAESSAFFEPVTTRMGQYEDTSSRRWLRCHDIPDGAFFSMKFSSAHIVYLLAEGTALDVPEQRPAGSTVEIQFSISRIYRIFATGPEMLQAGGICGMAITEDDTDSYQGSFAGYVSKGSAHFVFSRVLDELLDPLKEEPIGADESG